MDPKSASYTRDEILRIRPQVVALELDEGRLAALMNPGKAKGRGGGGSFIAMMMLERFAGALTGSAPGSEMLRAVEAAGMVGAKIAFIDLPIGITAGSLRKLPWGEKIRLGVDSVISLVLLPFGRFDFSKLTVNLEEQMAVFRQRYPHLSKLLLEDREAYMVARLRDIMRLTTGPVVAVVGFGHMKSLAKSLGSIPVQPNYPSNITWSWTPGR